MAASIKFGAAVQYPNSPTINAVAQLATRDATTDFQTAAIIGAILKSIGLTAYHKAGIVRIKRDKLQHIAIAGTA